MFIHCKEQSQQVNLNSKTKKSNHENTCDNDAGPSSLIWEKKSIDKLNETSYDENELKQVHIFFEKQKSCTCDIQQYSNHKLDSVANNATTIPRTKQNNDGPALFNLVNNLDREKLKRKDQQASLNLKSNNSNTITSSKSNMLYKADSSENDNNGLVNIFFNEFYF